MHSMAIIGYGGMASYHHKMLKKCEFKDIKVTGAYDILPESIDRAREAGLKIYSTPEELYSDTEIDLVLVATPNDTHRHYSIACMESGKNVICEKPVAMSAAELEDIIAVSQKTGKFFTVHQNRRWDSDFLTVKKILDENIVSKPFAIESRVQGSRQFLHGWRGYKQNGGGMLYDWGVHLIDQMLRLIPGKVEAISANLHSIYTEEVDDNFTATYRFENGLSFLVNVSNHCFAKQPRWHICGESSAAVIEDWDLNGNIIQLNQDKSKMSWDEVIVYTSAGPTRSMAPRPAETIDSLPLPVVKGRWIEEFYGNVVDCIEGRAEQLIKHEENLRVMRLIDLTFEAHKNKSGVVCSI